MNRVTLMEIQEYSSVLNWQDFDAAASECLVAPTGFVDEAPEELE